MLEKKGLDGRTLKTIASLCMLADHVCLILFSKSRAAFYVRGTIGRIAFPVYVFLLTEGFFHTKSRTKYILRLLVFSLISDPFFDLAFFGRFPDFGHQNVFFTLLIGFLLLCVLEKIRESFARRNPEEAAAISGKCFLVQLPFIVVFMAGAYFLKTDYSYLGVCAVAVMFYFKNLPVSYRVLAGCLALNVPRLHNIGAFLSVIPLSFYNFRKGRITKAEQLAFYAFYPAHLLVLWLVHRLL